MSVIFPIAYFGSISYYKDLISEKDINFEINENYLKQSIRNRTKILSANGVMELSIPVIKKDGSKTLTKNIQVSNSKDWRKDHWRAIESAYKNAAYFDFYGDEVKELIYNESIYLVDFIKQIENRIKKWLDLPYFSSDSEEFIFISDRSTDYRFGYTSHPFTSEYNYFQVFRDKDSFVGDLSILDAIFNLGPMARKLLIN
jgi:hypothetical protein